MWVSIQNVVQVGVGEKWINLTEVRRFVEYQALTLVSQIAIIILISLSFN